MGVIFPRTNRRHTIVGVSKLFNMFRRKITEKTTKGNDWVHTLLTLGHKSCAG